MQALPPQPSLSGLRLSYQRLEQLVTTAVRTHVGDRAQLIDVQRHVRDFTVLSHEVRTLLEPQLLSYTLTFQSCFNRQISVAIYFHRMSFSDCYETLIT
jgi:hypothetical protein